MRQYELKNGGFGIFLKIEFMVTTSVFAQQLCEHFYRKSEFFPEKLTKKEAKKILIQGLKRHGRQGEYDSDSLGTDNIDEYNEIYTNAKQWVSENYPNIV